MHPNFEAQEKKTTEERSEKIFIEALQRHQGLGGVDPEKLRALIPQELERIDEFEAAALEDEQNRFAVPEAVAKKINAIWVLSGPGTYEKPFQETENEIYKSNPWFAGFDRVRLRRTALLARHIAEARSGYVHPDFSKTSLEERKAATKELIEKYGPYIIYNGAAEQSAGVEEVMEREGLIIPKDKVRVIKGEIYKTVDQMKIFDLPEGVAEQGGEIAVVSHAPHLDRFLHMENRYHPIPKALTPRLFPIASPPEGREKYAQMEIEGLLYYIYLSKDHDATEEVGPYILNRPEASAGA